MSGHAWPSREEWQAKAEYAVRTHCTMYERLERLQPDTVWTSLAEDTELEELAMTAASAVRPLLTAEINRLRKILPDRPRAGRARTAWFIALEGQAYEDACNLASIEGIRAELHTARRREQWGTVVWHLGRIRRHCVSITLPPGVLAAHDRMQELLDTAAERRKAAAVAAEEAAVQAEIARRATNEAWQKELERRASIDSPRVILVGAQTPPTEGDQVT